MSQDKTKLEAAKAQVAKPMDISIMGRELKVACPVGEESQLTSAVELLNQKMQEIKDAGKVVSFDRIAMIAALNIAHELLKSKSGKNLLDSSESKRRINSMSKMLDQAIAEQEKLF
ncbi:MAG: cell division protein ZapA [Burkholderiales bacterium]